MQKLATLQRTFFVFGRMPVDQSTPLLVLQSTLQLLALQSTGHAW